MSAVHLDQKPEPELRVPIWYAGLVVAIILVGGALLGWMAVMYQQKSSTVQLEPWDAVLGSNSAPVTIVEWGSVT